MDSDFRIDIGEVQRAIDVGEITALYFPLLRKTLLMDTRTTGVDGPMIKVVPMASSPEERFRDLVRMRPRLPKPESINIVPWPKYVASLVRLEVWDHIVRRFLEASHKPSLMVFMVQREVARRMAASPGDMSLLSVAVQLYGRPRIVSYVPPRAFRPAPKVTSAIVRIDVFTKPAVAFERPDDFFDVVRAGFSAPRKQLRNSLTHGLAISSEAAVGLLTQADIDPRRRAETLSLHEWDLLYRAHQGQGS